MIKLKVLSTAAIMALVLPMLVPTASFAGNWRGGGAARGGGGAPVARFSGGMGTRFSGGGDDPAYCAQTYRSYDPRSGTYLGYDGLRHPCP